MGRGKNNVLSWNPCAGRRAATHLEGQIGGDMRQIASYNGGLDVFSSDDHGPSLQRVDSSGRAPFMIVSGHQETLGRRDIRFRHAYPEGPLCKDRL